MRSQQEAERREQQRIKSLVLNYDLMDDQHDGEEPAFHYIPSAISKRTVLVGKGSLNKSLRARNSDQFQRSITPDKDSTSDAENPIESTIQRRDSFANESGHIDHPHTMPRQDKSGNSRSKQRARKLQLTDMDWYGKQSPSTTSPPETAPMALDTFITEKKSQSTRAANGEHRLKHKG